MLFVPEFGPFEPRISPFLRSNGRVASRWKKPTDQNLVAGVAPHIFYPTCDAMRELDFTYTMLHELAHACCRNHGHDAVWQSKAVELGKGPAMCGTGIVNAERLAAYYDPLHAKYLANKQALANEKK